MSARAFTLEDAKPAAINLLMVVYGESGSGKTYSALRLARGMRMFEAGISESDPREVQAEKMRSARPIVAIDTENKRALHYAKSFAFKHLDFKPPFSPMDYREAMERAFAANPCAVIVDTYTHEHEGEGGVLDMHEAELQRMAGDDWQKREKCKFAAWIKPKGQRKKLRELLTHAPCHVILCMRAKQVIDLCDPRKPQLGGTLPEGDEKIIYEAALSAYLPAGAEGVPDWAPKHPSEKRLVKKPGQFAALIDSLRGKPMDERMGSWIARWAKNGEIYTQAAPAKEAS